MTARILASTENMSYADWLELRRQGIGGSEASVVCGINRYKSPVELWMEKTNQMPSPEDEAFMCQATPKNSGGEYLYIGCWEVEQGITTTGGHG